jgi:hypothetical protein
MLADRSIISFPHDRYRLSFPEDSSFIIHLILLFRAVTGLLAVLATIAGAVSCIMGLTA